MKKHLLTKTNYFILIIAFLCSCTSSVNPKKKIAVEITQESCQTISEITSGIYSGIVNTSVNQLLDINTSDINTGNAGEVPGYWCECYTFYVSKDLMENFTSDELREIKSDNIKKIMVLSKIFQAHQDEIKSCIDITTAEKIKSYADFERKFNRKLNSQVQSSDNNLVHSDTKTSISKSGKTTIKMEKVNGVYQIPVEINGIPMFFIFDTGASIISISETETMFLYKQGKLAKEDIIGTANFMDANGDISEGTIIILRTVQIGNKTLKNIEASVVHNLIAPLLLGQSALEQFGKISIDNQKGEITFE